MAYRWRTDDGPTWNGLGSFVIFQGIPTSIAKEPYIFVIFQGGPRPPVPPLDPHMKELVQTLPFPLCDLSNASLIKGNVPGI